MLKDRNLEIDGGILLRDREIEMLVTAWYPHVFFKLSFGTQDKISSTLKPIPHLEKNKNLLSKTGRQKLRKHLAFYGEVLDYKLMRHVPYRILRPFFAAETRGMPDQRVNREVSKLAAEQFYERRPFFRFDDSVDPRANSSKSDHLPPEIYIDHLAETQCDALSIARDIFSDEKWKEEVAPY